MISNKPVLKNSHWEAESYSKNSELQYTASKKFLANYKFKGDESVLDIGCGHGLLTSEIADLVPRGKVIGIDNSLSMIELAKKNCNKLNLSFKFMDAQDINFPEKFDVIFSSFCIQWIIDKAPIFRGIAKHMHENTKVLLIMPLWQEEVAALRAELMQNISWQPFFKDYFEIDSPSFVRDQRYEEHARKVGLNNIHYELNPVATKFANAEKLAAFLRNITFCLTRLPNEELKDKFIRELVVLYLEKHLPKADGSCEITYTYAQLIATGINSAT